MEFRGVSFFCKVWAGVVSEQSNSLCTQHANFKADGSCFILIKHIAILSPTSCCQLLYILVCLCHCIVRSCKGKQRPHVCVCVCVRCIYTRTYILVCTLTCSQISCAPPAVQVSTRMSLRCYCIQCFCFWTLIIAMKFKVFSFFLCVHTQVCALFFNTIVLCILSMALYL